MLGTEQLERQRSSPTADGSYLVQGEYGRILSAWLEYFPQRQFHVLSSCDLADSQLRAVSLVCDFLGVRPLGGDPVPPEHVSGSNTLVPADEVERLNQLMRQHVFPEMPKSARRAFKYWFKIWNVVPEAPPVVPAETRERLLAHYATDQAVLQSLGVLELGPTTAA